MLSTTSKPVISYNEILINIQLLPLYSYRIIKCQMPTDKLNDKHAIKLSLFLYKNTFDYVLSVLKCLITDTIS
nr:hypothetical protein BAR15_150022 [Bartonella sp. AR 15-3]